MKIGEFHQKCYFHDISPFWGKWLKKGATELFGYLLKLKNHSRNWCFEPLGRKSAKMHPKVAFSRQSALLAPKSPFCEKVRFWGQKSIPGDSSGISTNLRWEFIMLRAFTDFVFAVTRRCFLVKILQFMYFMTMSILWHFTTFRVASWKSPPEFATPLVLFSQP